MQDLLLARSPLCHPTKRQNTSTEQAVQQPQYAPPLQVLVLHPYTKSEVRRPSYSKDLADFRSRHLSVWWPWPLTLELMCNVTRADGFLVIWLVFYSKFVRKTHSFSDIFDFEKYLSCLSESVLLILVFLRLFVLWVMGKHASNWRCPLTFRPLNGVMGHPCHGLPSCQFSACYTLSFLT